jgi:hypothetical protein
MVEVQSHNQEITIIVEVQSHNQGIQKQEHLLPMQNLLLTKGVLTSRLIQIQMSQIRSNEKY